MLGKEPCGEAVATSLRIDLANVDPAHHWGPGHGGDPACVYGNVLVPLTGWGFSFVCTHMCTRAHTHTCACQHGALSQNPSMPFPFSVEKNQLCLVSLSKSHFDGVILFQSRALQSAPQKQTRGGWRGGGTLSSNIRASRRFPAAENIDGNQHSAAAETSPLIELGKVNPDSGLCTL